MSDSPSLLLFDNCDVFDGHSAELLEGVRVLVEGERIMEVSRSASASGAQRIDCGGRVLMPGLIDAHFHAYSPSFDVSGLDRMPMSLLAQYAAVHLSRTLKRGFTTVRDAAGGDIGLWLALERGLIEGPRFFYSGKAISQTGGHGDMRRGDRVEPCSCGFSSALTVVADGPDEVRKAAREELRKGAQQVKIFVSGGVISPTDPISMPQLCEAEIRAAVEEAASRRTYVMAHCHTAEGARRCVAFGVRSIEHGTDIDDATAAAIAAAGAYVVPTLAIVDLIRNEGSSLGMPPMSLPKIAGMYEQMLTSIETCMRHGVKLGLGVDLFDTRFHALQGHELQLRGEVSSPIDVLRSATSVNAELLQKAGELGCIAPGAYADLLVLDGNPIEDLGLFAKPERNVLVVMKAGRFVRNSL